MFSIRLSNSDGGGKMLVLEGRAFYLILPSLVIPSGNAPENLAPSILQLQAPLILVGPDAQGWSSNNPTTAAQKCRDWRERIDVYPINNRHAILVFKIETSMKPFTPSPVWF